MSSALGLIPFDRPPGGTPTIWASKPLPALAVVPPPKERGTCFAVDIDSTLYDFSTPAREAFLKLAAETGDNKYWRGAYAAWVEWRTQADVCGLDTWLEVVSMCHATDVILSQTPFPGAVNTLNALVAEGHELMYISNRNEEAAWATKEWLGQEGFPLGPNAEVRCTMEEKAPFIAECQYLIDDRPKTLVEFVYDSTWYQPDRGKRKGISLLYEYNRALTDIPDIFLSPTWAGIASWLVHKGLLKESPHTPLEKIDG